jgi:hypothetical protein
MQKKKLWKVAGIALWAVYGVAVAELSVRLLSPQPLIPRYITGTDWGVRGNIPHARYRHKTPEVSVEYRINGQGMRADRDFPLVSTTGVCRIALFGDSYFMGYELNLEESVAFVLEKTLKAAGYESEVLNFAVSGFGTGEMLLTYRAQARRFHPDVVVMQWHETDPEDNLRSNLFALKTGELVQVSTSYLPSVAIQDFLLRFALYRIIADNSHLYSVVRERAAVAVKRLLVEANTARSAAVAESKVEVARSSESGAGGEDPGFSLSARLIELFQREVAADGSGFAVVDIPTPEGRTKLWSNWHELGNLKLDGVPVTLGSEVFSPMLSPDTKLYFERGHSHLTPIAASRLAVAIALSLEETLAHRNCGRAR